MEPKSTAEPGDVTSITWAKKKSQVDIDAKDVFKGGIWHASYTWDGDDTTLTLGPPKPGAKKAETKHHHPSAGTPVDITTLVIEGWGSSPLSPPLEWTGPQSGTVDIIFQDGPHTSGPVGGVDGP